MRRTETDRHSERDSHIVPPNLKGHRLDRFDVRCAATHAGIDLNPYLKTISGACVFEGGDRLSVKVVKTGLSDVVGRSPTFAKSAD